MVFTVQDFSVLAAVNPDNTSGVAVFGIYDRFVTETCHLLSLAVSCNSSDISGSSNSAVERHLIHIF
ncbi:hypothetical protein DXA96_06780 [Lachnospiraceae bacterium OF09-33XD]|nr:hypothetical protein DXA96_06780 [Lachnospiraceae bacterium OF09-33XD]